MSRHRLLLEETSGPAFDEMEPRARAAILAMANAALKTSAFKLGDDEEGVLGSWLEPTATIARKALFHFEYRLDRQGSDDNLKR